MAEWSNAPDLRSGSFGSAGSNPAPCIFFYSNNINIYFDTYFWYIFLIYISALLAQSGERATVNREAAGSKPARSALN